MALTKDTIADRNALLSHRKQRVTIVALVAGAFFPAVCGASIPGPPMLVVALAVERALTGNGDVALFEGVDEGRIVEQLDAFPTRENNRQIIPGVRTELDRRAFRDFEIDVVLQMNSACEIRSRCYDNSAAAGFRALIDGSAKSRGAVCFAVAVGGEVERAIWKTRGLDAREDPGHHGLPGVIGGE